MPPQAGPAPRGAGPSRRPGSPLKPAFELGRQPGAAARSVRCGEAAGGDKMDAEQALARIRDEIRSLHSNPDAVLADFFDCVNVNEEGQLVVDGEVVALDGSKQAVRLRF